MDQRFPGGPARTHCLRPKQRNKWMHDSSGMRSGCPLTDWGIAEPDVFLRANPA